VIATLHPSQKTDRRDLGFTQGDAMRAVYMASPYFLGREVLGYSKFCETQLEWSDYLTTRYNPKKPSRLRSLVLSPRETYKSTFWTVTEAIWLLLNNPNLTILIVSETVTNADSFLREIRQKLQSDTFRMVFGDLIDPSLDRADALNFITRTVYTKEANIETAGLGKAITGKHFDIILGDDLAGVQDRDSPAKRVVTFNFLNDIMDVLKKDIGFLQIVGTRWHRQDIYAHIIDKLAPDLERKKLGKFHIYVKPAHDKKTGKVNYPRLLSERKLLELKTVKQGKDGVDISTYMAQYELDPMSPEEQIFKTFHYVDPATVKLERFVEWTDPALSDKGTACFAATVILGKIVGEAKWMAVYASVARKVPSKIIADHNRIFRMVRKLYAIPGSAFMEDNGFQLLLKNNAVAASVKEGEDVPTIGRGNTENKEARIRGMEPYVSQGFIVFRSDWETAPEGYRLLMEQLSSFPQGFKDAVDALQSAHKQTQSRFMS
jgi:hypothetical protein